MAKFNPDFWEMIVSQKSWSQFSCEDGLYYQDPVAQDRRQASRDRVCELFPEIRALMVETLTQRQQKVVTLYFFEELNQRQISEHLGITQQAVSEHLYGKVRAGRAVGGALRKLRKACRTRGITWDGDRGD